MGVEHVKTVTQQHSAALIETTDGAKGAAAVHAPVGELVADCHIDLPPNDVVDFLCPAALCDRRPACWS
jgi:hypothetical protein